MKIKTKLVLASLFLILCGCDRGPETVAWTHLELGAGNYGQEGHTKGALNKTVVQALSYISDRPNFIDELPIVSETELTPETQYAVLFSTLDQLVAQHGDYGVFHVNDLVPAYSDFAAAKLSNYSIEKGYHITIASIPGDYMAINPKETLSKYSQETYSSVHLKNPEVSFYHYGLDGEKFLANEESRKKARTKLQHLANLSSEGLYFFPIDYRDYFIPQEEKDDFISKDIFYQSTEAWKPVAYDFPDGQQIPVEYGRVLFIPAHKSTA